jgi:hypothetical protein
MAPFLYSPMEGFMSLSSVLSIFEPVIELVRKADSDPILLALFGTVLFLLGAALRRSLVFAKLTDPKVAAGGHLKTVAARMPFVRRVRPESVVVAEKMASR